MILQFTETAAPQQPVELEKGVKAWFNTSSDNRILTMCVEKNGVHYMEVVDDELLTVFKRLARRAKLKTK